MNFPETFTLSALRIPWFQFLFQSNHQEMVEVEVKNCAIGEASFSCTGQLIPILENELPVFVAETADDPLLEDTTLAFVDISCPVVTVTLDTCVAKVATLADVAGNLDELLFSARCALSKRKTSCAILKWLQECYSIFPSSALKMILDLSRKQMLVTGHI